MNKTYTTGIFAVLALSLILLSSNTSAYYAYPKSSSTYSLDFSYRESPGIDVFPKEKLNQLSLSNFVNNNFDSTKTNYEYRGPMFERRIIQSQDFSSHSSDKSLPFYSSSKQNTQFSVRNELVEKYVGATESFFSDSQNRRTQSANTNQNTSYNFDGGFSFGKQRLFDSSEFAKESYAQPYYYSPVYNYDRDYHSGYYNWRY